jgi:hypothetical protein
LALRWFEKEVAGGLGRQLSRDWTTAGWRRMKKNYALCMYGIELGLLHLEMVTMEAVDDKRAAGTKYGMMLERV